MITESNTKANDKYCPEQGLVISNVNKIIHEEKLQSIYFGCTHRERREGERKKPF